MPEDVKTTGYLEVNVAVWNEMVCIVKAAKLVTDKLNGVVGMPEFTELSKALEYHQMKSTARFYDEPIDEDERDNLDRVNDEMQPTKVAKGRASVDEAFERIKDWMPPPTEPQTVAVEDAPVKTLLDLLLSEQMPPQRFVEEAYRRAATEGTSFILLRL